jgi:hypothetical protein
MSCQRLENVRVTPLTSDANVECTLGARPTFLNLEVPSKIVEKDLDEPIQIFNWGDTNTVTAVGVYRVLEHNA